MTASTLPTPLCPVSSTKSVGLFYILCKYPIPGKTTEENAFDLLKTRLVLAGPTVNSVAWIFFSWNCEHQ
uniref:Uncharacterized protein n=1 Tax=Anguilla anguilla TaxID=7936 RepID=A0A0E9PBR1_ANGAN